jgi:SpoVK/Ycf46/Vps4 family AAA+-type ATPase
MLKSFMKGIRHDLSDVHFAELADHTEGWSSADVQALCREAALGPVRSLYDSYLVRHILGTKSTDEDDPQYRYVDEPNEGITKQEPGSEFDVTKTGGESFRPLGSPPHSPHLQEQLSDTDSNVSAKRRLNEKQSQCPNITPFAKKRASMTQHSELAAKMFKQVPPVTYAHFHEAYENMTQQVQQENTTSLAGHCDDETMGKTGLPA